MRLQYGQIATASARRVSALVAAFALALTGCGTTRVTDTSRTATEQLLISRAVDDVVSQIDFRILAGNRVFFDPQYIEKTVDGGYLVSSLRQQLLAHGALLQEDRTKAAIVVEARSGSIGTDRQDVLIGVPQMTLPALYPGVPSLIPEIPLAKKTQQRGVAKIAVYAYHRSTGRPVWQSGTVQNDATARDTWVLGAGPFRRGSLSENLGQLFADLPLVAAHTEVEPLEPWITATQFAAWPVPPESRLGVPTAVAAPPADAPKLTTSNESVKTVGHTTPPLPR